MKVLVLQHAPFEGIGSMGTWLGAAGAQVRTNRLFQDPRLASVDGLDLVVAMGGPMSVNDEARFAWLSAEKRLLRQAIERGVAVLGVCLGAQLIASALGARVTRNPVREIGWFAVDGLACGQDDFRFPHRFTAFHWHGETFDLPDGAVRLARTGACENQAFQIGRRTVGLQFHLEVTPGAVEAMLENGGADLADDSPFVQSQAEIRSADRSVYASIERLMGDVLSYLTGAQAPA